LNLSNKIISKKKSAFTLIEVILSLGLGALTLVSTLQVMFSLQQIWTETQTQNAFDQHVDGTCFFLQFIFNNASSSKKNPTTEIPRGKSKNIEIVQPNWADGFNDSYFQLSIQSPPAIFSDNSSPLNSPITIFFNLSTQNGLQFKWHSSSKNVENILDLYQTKISPFVDKIDLWYFNPEFQTWEKEDDFLEKNNESLIPDFLEITFKIKETLESRYIYLRKGF
jgi:hypothetical protein